MAQFKRQDPNKTFPMTVRLGAAVATIYADGSIKGNPAEWNAELAKLGENQSPVPAENVHWYWTISRALNEDAVRLVAKGILIPVEEPEVLVEATPAQALPAPEKPA